MFPRNPKYFYMPRKVNLSSAIAIALLFLTPAINALDNELMFNAKEGFQMLLPSGWVRETKMQLDALTALHRNGRYMHQSSIKLFKEYGL